MSTNHHRKLSWSKGLLAAFFVALSFLSFIFAPQKAQAQDWQFEFGAGYIAELAGSQAHNAELFNGFNMNFAINHKLNDWVRLLSFEASFRIIPESSDNLCAMPEYDENGYPKYNEDLKEYIRKTEYCDSEYIGFSLFYVPRFTLYSHPSADVYAKVGPGIIFASYNDRMIDFGIRVGVGANYWITKNLGIGLNVDYDLAVLGTKKVIDRYGYGRQVAYIDALLQIAFKW